MTLKKESIISSHKVSMFCKFHEIWVETLGEMALRNEADKQRDGQTDMEYS